MNSLRSDFSRKEWNPLPIISDNFKGAELHIEPARKDTAAAICLAAMTLRPQDPETVMAVLSADHFMKDEDQFLEILKVAIVVAKRGYLVTLGAKPS